MKSVLSSRQQSWGRRIRFHCNEVNGSVPVDMTLESDYQTVFSAKHYFKYASGVYGTSTRWPYVLSEQTIKCIYLYLASALVNPRVWFPRLDAVLLRPHLLLLLQAGP
jgi:hypothetical protein